MTNKERIENLEVRFGGVQDSMSLMEVGFVDKFHQIADTLQRLSNTLVLNIEGSNNNILDLSLLEVTIPQLQHRKN